MRFLALLALGGSLGLATASSAQVVGVVTSRTANLDGYQTGGSGGGNNFTFNGPVENGSTQFYNNDSTVDKVYVNYQISTDVNASAISFANNITASGYMSQSSNSTTVEITYTNPNNYAINPTLHSQIIPGGFGVYFGSPAGNPTLSAGVMGDINQTPESRTSKFYNALNNAFQPDPFQIGYAGFSFTIKSGDSTVAAYSGSLTLNSQGVCNFSNIFTCGYLDANGGVVVTPTLSLNQPGAMPLTNFGLIAADDPNAAVGYSWDATDVIIPLGVLGAHQSTTLTYVTSVSVGTFADIQGNGDMLVAYAGFGDPIGKTAGAGGIPDPAFPLLDLGLPDLNPVTGDVTVAAFQGYDPTPLPLGQGLTPSPPPPPVPPAPPPAPVPEPAAWAMMLVGSVLVGGGLRRRRREIGTA